jgi:hypothetical protein
MRPTTDVSYETMSDAEFYAWDIPDIFSAHAVASRHCSGLMLFWLEKGLPNEIFLERVHPDDRPCLAPCCCPQGRSKTGIEVVRASRRCA